MWDYLQLSAILTHQYATPVIPIFKSETIFDVVQKHDN